MAPINGLAVLGIQVSESKNGSAVAQNQMKECVE